VQCRNLGAAARLGHCRASAPFAACPGEGHIFIRNSYAATFAFISIFYAPIDIFAAAIGSFRGRPQRSADGPFAAESRTAQGAVYVGCHLEIGKQLLMTRGALTIAHDVAKSFAISPTMFLAFYYPQLLALNLINLANPQSEAITLNALFIIGLILLALRGVAYRPIGAGPLLRRNPLVYGLGGIVVPFAGIKAIDVVVTVLHLA